MRDTEGNLLKDTILQERYKIVELIDIGLISKMYKAYDTKYNKYVFVKELITKYKVPYLRQQAVEQFKGEARILFKYKHINLPKFDDYFDYEENRYLIIDYIEGNRLSTLVEGEEDFLPEKLVIQWGIDLCDVLSYFHNMEPKPVIFRDMNPHSIFLSEEGILKLIDFGISKEYEIEGKTRDVAKVMIPHYSPIEQHSGGTDTRSDIYSLGATLYYLITKEPPMDSLTRSFEDEPMKTCKEINPHISLELDGIIMKAMEMSRKNRYQNIEEMKADLACLLELLKDDNYFPPEDEEVPVITDLSGELSPEESREFIKEEPDTGGVTSMDDYVETPIQNVYVATDGITGEKAFSKDISLSVDTYRGRDSYKDEVSPVIPSEVPLEEERDYSSHVISSEVSLEEERDYSYKDEVSPAIPSEVSLEEERDYSSPVIPSEVPLEEERDYSYKDEISPVIPSEVPLEEEVKEELLTRGIEEKGEEEKISFEERIHEVLEPLSHISDKLDENLSVNREINIEEVIPLPTKGRLIRERYEIIELLKGRHLTKVYKGIDMKRHVPVIIKEFFLDNVLKPENAKALDFIYSKIELIFKLFHPNLPVFEEFFAYEDKDYLVMEYIDGETMKSIIENSNVLPPVDLVLEWALQLCGALDYLHSREAGSIIFSALSPDNIIRDMAGILKLVDFGISKLYVPPESILLGTEDISINFSSPEEYNGQLDTRSDIYSLGAMLYYLLTGKVPPDAGDRMIWNLSFQPGEFNQHIPSGLIGIVLTATEIDKNKRFQSILEMQECLENL